MKKTKEEKIEETGGELTNIPNEKYRKFFEKFAEIETLEVEQWKVAHLLGYFCKKYKDHYKVDYSWSFKSQSPSKCFEVYQINVLGSKMSTNPKIIKEYIDWSFINTVPQAKRRLTSISFLTREEVVIHYKMKILLGDKKNLDVSRSSPLPAEYRSVFDQAGTEIQTYGDLAFISQMTSMPAPLKAALDKIEEMGFDKSVLSRIV